MMYSKEFNDLIAHVDNGYIGHGNPNAKILFVGQEPAWNRNTQAEHYDEEIGNNCSDWKKIVTENIGYDSIDLTKSEYTSPLNPWPLQQFQVRSGDKEKGTLKGEKGTARTWYVYQKIINSIYGKSLGRNEVLTLHRLSFHTDMSDEAYKKHKEAGDLSKASVVKRMEILSHPFFRQFPVVIAAVGHFPRDSYGDSYFKDVFNVDFVGNQAFEDLPWINVNIREDENPQIVIHCQQVTAHRIGQRYFDRIVEIVKEFIEKHDINIFIND